MDNAGPDKEHFWDSVSCRKYTEVNNCVVRRVQYREDYFSKNVRATFKKPSSGPRKRYELSLCIAVHPSRLLAGAEFLITRAQLLIRDFSSLLAVYVCVVLLDSSIVFCGCTLTHTATVSCSVWTTDHAHLCIS